MFYKSIIFLSVWGGGGIGWTVIRIKRHCGKDTVFVFALTYTICLKKNQNQFFIDFFKLLSIYPHKE